MAELVILQEALDDTSEAYDWYNERSEGLGLEFLGCVDDCIHRIQSNPAIYQIVFGNYRRAIVRRFPFVVFYEIVDDTSQHPSKWRKRLP